MPIRNSRPPRRSRRICALITTCIVLATGGLAVPSSAGAYTDHFCQFARLGSGWNCFASNRHSLWAVNGWSIDAWQRICAASYTSPWGSQNSDWRCDYGQTSKLLGGRVDGVGALHNGDPYPLTAYGTQDF